MIIRKAENRIMHLLKIFPCVAIIGPRQVGKTTLAKSVLQKINKKVQYLDLERTRDLQKLSDAEHYISQFPNDFFIIDEVQRKRSIFPVLRALIDENRIPGRFLLLGSASPELIRDSSESLAGRIAYYELSPLLINEIKTKQLDRLWIQGGFPLAFLHPGSWIEWMNQFVKTYLEKELPNLGFPAFSSVSEPLWTMLAHNHGNLTNYSEIAKSLEISVNTVKSHINFLEKAFLIRQIRPYHVQLKKRVVKAAKIYIRDSGILHFLLGLENKTDLFGNYKRGASWEGFVIEQIYYNLPINCKLFYFRTYDGAELDLLIEKGGKIKTVVEIKYGTRISLSRGNLSAAKHFEDAQKYLVVRDDSDYMLSNGFRVCGIQRFVKEYLNEGRVE